MRWLWIGHRLDERWLWVLLIQRPPPPETNSDAHSQSDSTDRHMAERLLYVRPLQRLLMAEQLPFHEKFDLCWNNTGCILLVSDVLVGQGKGILCYHLAEEQLLTTFEAFLIPWYDNTAKSTGQSKTMQSWFKGCKSVAVSHLVVAQWAGALSDCFQKVSDCFRKESDCYRATLSKGIWLLASNSLLTISPRKMLPIKIPNERSSLPESYIGDAKRFLPPAPAWNLSGKNRWILRASSHLLTVWCIWECWCRPRLINIKTCCMGLERRDSIWDAEYMVSPELAAPATPLWPQCLRGRMIVWSGKELFVIARLTRSTVDTVSLQTIGETRFALWVLCFPLTIFPVQVQNWDIRVSHKLNWLSLLTYSSMHSVGWLPDRGGRYGIF